MSLVNFGNIKATFWFHNLKMEKKKKSSIGVFKIKQNNPENEK